MATMRLGQCCFAFKDVRREGRKGKWRQLPTSVQQCAHPLVLRVAEPRVHRMSHVTELPVMQGATQRCAATSFQASPCSPCRECQPLAIATPQSKRPAGSVPHRLMHLKLATQI